MRFIILVISLISTAAIAKDFSGLYKQLDPSVVIIYSDSKAIRAAAGQQELVTLTSSSLGTGTLINNEGLILTAAHVVNSADEITVDVKNRGKFKAKVLSTYQGADIALVKLLTTKEDFKAVTVADSDQTDIGEEVFVIGTPYGLGHTLTVGHLSGKRTHTGLGNRELEFLQTDAAINQGNSGGPLFNSKGELIGVVSYIETQSGGNEGLGFAASSNMVKRILIDQPLIWFGMEFSVLSSGMAAAFNLPQDSGLLVEKVAKQSFADQVGIKGGVVEVTIQNQTIVIGGDVILAIGPITITGEESNYERIVQYLNSLKGGERIPFKLLRKGAVIEMSAEKPNKRIKLI
ncbi:hypothetical protein PULV_b0907 [Pseudoalteromonas ulvae UL12]|uniref:S1C family serine protease n=1 Tax=Pseudoalteromonas ulvae TaxID=107327 RepID=UPI00186B7ED1|nr:trypsin-like peptidase domain-containing protein [Pseudoalteromonas ulvae]MBE0366159.1 hypothetical protein [Pseudoalteromonas ulvae UL12]